MNTKQDHQPEDANTPPVHVADCGRVRASVWEQSAKGTTRHKVIISRRFTRNGEWIRGRTFYADELPAVIEVSARVQRWIDRREREAQAQFPLAAA